MKITVIGIGNIGGTIAQRLAAAGHEVSVASSRGGEKLIEFAQRISARPVDVQDAADDAEAVILSVPTEAMPDVAAKLRGRIPPTIAIVDTSNYVPGLRDREIPELEHGAVESEWISNLFGHRVIKAFNSINYRSLQGKNASPGTPGRIALPVAGDDADQKRLVMGLVDLVGFDPVDGGTLADSWHQQPGTPVYTTDLGKEQVQARLSLAKPAQTLAWREEKRHTGFPGQR